MTARVRVIGGPWPERVGCTGRIVTPTAEQARWYPFYGRHPSEVVVLLDADPLACGRRGCHHNPGDLGCTVRGDPPWSCAISRKHLEHVEP